MSKRHYIIPIFVSHRGCPHDCIFCNQKKITGQGGDVSGEDVKLKIEEYLQTITKMDAEVEVAFYGGSFTAIPIEQQKELLAAVQPYIENKLVRSIRVSTRPDCIDLEIIGLLKTYKVQIVELGVQSMDQEVLTISNRGHSPEAVIEAIKLLKGHGFTVGVQVMIGLPGDTEAKSIATVKQLIEQKPDMARIYPALVITNTYMEKLYYKGLYQPLSLETAVEISKKLLLLFEKAEVEVIRIGLQPTENIIEGKEVVAGPFHSAMRQLVMSSIYLDMLKVLMDAVKPTEQVEIRVNPYDVSDVLGQKRCNIEYLKNHYHLKAVTVLQSQAIERRSLMLNNHELTRTLSIKDFHKILQI